MDDSRYIVGKSVKDEPTIQQPQGAGVFPKVPFRLLLTGPSASGKTNLGRWMLNRFYIRENGKSWFDRIYLLSPTGNIDHVWKDLDGLKPKDRITAPTPELLDKIFNDQKREILGSTNDEAASHMSLDSLSRRKTRAKRILIIFDDAIAEKIMTSNSFLKLFIAGRHYNISSLVLTQSYVKIMRSARIQASAVCMFPSKTSEIARLYAEHGPKELNKNEFTELVQYATSPTDSEPYPFFYVDVFAPVKTRFRRGFTNVLELHDGNQQVENRHEEEKSNGMNVNKRKRKAEHPPTRDED